MPQDMSNMVAVASGSKKEVGTWAKILRAAAIGFLVVTSTGTPESSAPSAVELWVISDDADEARTAIRSADPGDKHRLW